MTLLSFPCPSAHGPDKMNMIQELWPIAENYQKLKNLLRNYLTYMQPAIALKSFCTLALLSFSCNFDVFLLYSHLSPRQYSGGVPVSTAGRAGLGWQAKRQLVKLPKKIKCQERRRVRLWRSTCSCCLKQYRSAALRVLILTWSCPTPTGSCPYPAVRLRGLSGGYPLCGWQHYQALGKS